jgi:rare lipoprotein A
MSGEHIPGAKAQSSTHAGMSGLKPGRISGAKAKAFTALIIMGALAGCHKSKQAYVPPPAAATAPVVVATGSAPGKPSAAKKEPAPLAPATTNATDDADALNGKPVSTEIGMASWYGPPYHNHQAADGSVFDQNALTAAHRTLPMGTMVRVTNVATNESVVVKITDRGPFVAGRTLDLSLAAAKAIGVYRAGVAKVKVEAFARPGSDPEGKWCVQIGVFIDPADAVQTKNDLMLRYKTAKVIEFAGPTGHWVRINPPGADHASAQKIADSIHLPDADSFLVRLN